MLVHVDIRIHRPARENGLLRARQRQHVPGQAQRRREIRVIRDAPGRRVRRSHVARVDVQQQPQRGGLADRAPTFVLYKEIAREKPAPVHHGERRKINVLVLLRIALHVYFAAREHPHEVLLNQHFPAAAEQARVYVRHVLQRGQQRAGAQRAFAVAIPAADDHFFPIGF